MNKVDLNERHGAHLKSEKQRIKAAGGKISADGAIYGVLYPSRGCVHGAPLPAPRFPAGGLAFSGLTLLPPLPSSFGDIDVKADGKPVVICTPNGAGIDEWEPYELSEDATTYLVVAR